MSDRAFIIRHRIYFNETNAVGGVVYFSNYVKWQGMSREKYFVETCPDWPDIMKQVYEFKLNMITVEEHSYFLQHAFFGDEITIELRTANAKKFSFDMLFLMKNGRNETVYEGMQKLAFDDFKGKYVNIPESMRRSVDNYATNDFSIFARLKKIQS